MNYLSMFLTVVLLIGQKFSFSTQKKMEKSANNVHDIVNTEIPVTDTTILL